MEKVILIGAGLSGLSAAIVLAEQGISSCLISAQPSERAQSVLAEGGINGALDTMGEQDTTEEHFADTMRGGVYMADPNAVDRLTKGAPKVIRWLESLGVPFNRINGDIQLRNFGGQKKKRTAFARSSTGKILMSALIAEVRKHEAAGLVTRYTHHEMIRLLMDENAEKMTCRGVRVRDRYTGRLTDFYGPVILACGGMNGIFPGMTTGTTRNTGDAAAMAFCQGVKLANLEMIQYHPTTIGISGKRCLVTEAARGEGGRLFIERKGQPWYFMEELYPELGNLMPRDVVSREIFFVLRREDCTGPVCLDMTGLSPEVWKNKLSDLREEIIHYMAKDPVTTPIPVEPGIHYFMGGIDVDLRHRTNVDRLYAAGECACQYHGANRLGGNSMLGAVFGGRTAAGDLAERLASSGLRPGEGPWEETLPADFKDPAADPASPVLIGQISRILLKGLGIVRNETELNRTLDELLALEASGTYNIRERGRLKLAEAMIRSAVLRKESRGAHYREDYPEKSEDFRKTAVASLSGDDICIDYRDLPERKGQA